MGWWGDGPLDGKACANEGRSVSEIEAGESKCAWSGGEAREGLAVWENWEVGSGQQEKDDCEGESGGAPRLWSKWYL